MRNLAIFCSLIIIISFLPPSNGNLANTPWIPPTNAFDKIHSDNGTIDAVNFSMPLNIKSGSGISVKSNNATHTLTISNSALSSIQGTYNTTQANNALINSGGYKINFINGSGATVHVQNSKSGTQVNVTVSSTGSGGTITSINSQAGPAVNIVGQTGNITITNSTNQIKINTGQNIANLATTNNQTFSGKVNFTGTTKLAPINLGMLSTPPSNLKQGDLWMDSSTGNNLKYRSSVGTSLTTASVQTANVFTAFNSFTLGQRVVAINFTSDANAISNLPIPNHNCGVYFVTGNSTFRYICNFNSGVHVLSKG